MREQMEEWNQVEGKTSPAWWRAVGEAAETNTQGGHNPTAAWAKPYGTRNHVKYNTMKSGPGEGGQVAGQGALSSDNGWEADRLGKAVSRGCGSQAAGGPGTV